MYTADPASPMQTTYSHNLGFHPEAAETMTIEQTQPVPPHPPPNYTEATALSGGLYGHFPPHYDSIMVGNEYPSHLSATLPHSSSTK